MGSRRAEKFQERFNVWPGFTDVIVGLLLVFVFVVTLFTITETVLSRSLSKKDKELQQLHSEISLKTEEMTRLHRLISEKTREMEQLHNDLSFKTAELEKMRSEMSRLEKLFEVQVEKAAGLEQLLAQRQDELKSAVSEIGQKTVRLEELERLVSRLQTEIESALSEIKDKTATLEDRERKAVEIGIRLSETETSLSKATAELTEKRTMVQELGSAVQALNARIAALTQRIASYVEEVARLNRLLAESKESESAEKTRASALQKEIVSMTGRLDEISKKLAEAEAEKEKGFRLSQLVDLIGKKDKEIARLRDLARYRSEFLARLAEVFSGVPDIRVHGDRFVFQSEILFASGRANINESGKQELDKFIRIYHEMAPKIPKDLPLLVLIEGHTDTVPVRSAQYRSNWELSSARAMAVVRYMIDKGIPPDRLGGSALGEFHPIAEGDSLEAKRLNRRIEIKITTL
ncbi:MAG: OmpA family protein [Deltaproteobacteria bacterium]|nr:OmpA family protein [Deltaproteobacteria bacterium]